jgi:hypothetical protein
MRDNLLQLTFLSALLLALPAGSLAQAEKRDVLTNADIVRMARAGISDSIIQREIQLSETNFTTSPTALIELKKQGVSDEVLGAILDSRAGRGSFMSASPISASPATPDVFVQSAPRPHHMPNFEADLRLNSTTQGKLSFGHNQIKLERSGKPLFDLKWKDLH